jgi:hypothetical protein
VDKNGKIVIQLPEPWSLAHLGEFRGGLATICPTTDDGCSVIDKGGRIIWRSKKAP